MNTPPQVLIACIGNIFLGDDGFGVEVARRFDGRLLPAGVILKDFGIRSLDLTYALLENYKLVVLVDACRRGGEPGSVYLIEADPSEFDILPGKHVALDAHTMNPLSVLRAVKEMGGNPGRVLIVGCEPAEWGSDEGKLGLSDIVSAAVGEAVKVIESLVSDVIQTVEQEVQAN